MRHLNIAKIICMLMTVFLVSSCSMEEAQLPVEAAYGPNPTLVNPVKTLIPTVNISEAVGWPEGEIPHPKSGFAVQLFAKNLDHPRWLYVLPNNDVLVAETNAPPKPEGDKGIKDFFIKLVKKKAGAATPSANRITLLRDTNGDGTADTRATFLKDLNSPFGMALIDDYFYVANTDAVVRFPYNEGDTSITADGELIVPLPADPPNQHWTKSLVASPDGKHLYVGVGSNSNIAENGMVKEKNRAAILKINIAKKTHTVFASGLRNPVGMDWQPQSGELWTSVNERDELGSDLVPDYMTAVHQNDFFGWPYSYYGPNVDTRVKQQRPDMVAIAKKPDYALGAHTASLGLEFYDKNQFPEHYRNGAFIGQHGSWNRNPPSGYKVIFVPFKNGEPSGMPEDFLTGFLSADGKAYGRPVGLITDTKGALLLADDVGNIIWRVTKN